jgi:hypothetical protein
MVTFYSCGGLETVLQPEPLPSAAAYAPAILLRNDATIEILSNNNAF